MKLIFISTFFAATIFLFIDIIWLSFSYKSFYKPNIGHLMMDSPPVMWAAVLFYFIYTLSVAIVVIAPSVDSASILKPLYTGFFFGLAAYGTYNLTNMAVLKDWSASVVFVDMLWGGILTASSSTLGIILAKKFFS